MKFNQFSYIPVTEAVAEAELQQLGFRVDNRLSSKENLAIFVRHVLSLRYTGTEEALADFVADFETDLRQFFQSDQELDKEIFEMVALQLLGFIPYVDFTNVAEAVEKMAFPIAFDGRLNNLHQLLATRCASGNTLIDQLVSENLLPVTNDYVFFNGKSLATFDMTAVIREVVYVETGVDTDQDGVIDLVKVLIIRPQTDNKVPVMMTASPYQNGVNGPASDALTHAMEGRLTVKEEGQLRVEELSLDLLVSDCPAQLVEKTEETFVALPRPSYTLNDYMLARGLANIYVSGIGTRHSDGFMTTGDYQQVQAFKSVIDWLNGRARAFTARDRQRQVEATWASGKVATTGLSYLGTMSNALATTGVDGLDVIIAEAGISSWYDYYRENGLVVSPGGYPGEDLDSLTAFTYSRDLVPGDYLRHHETYQKLLEEQGLAIDRVSGDYNQFWHNRNYVRQADNIKAHVVYTHGTQDWNVKPIHVFQMFNALSGNHPKHLFLHHGAHVYMNAWQSIDFRESMNALLTQKLLGIETDFTLPPIIWQDNQSAQTWQSLDSFGGEDKVAVALTSGTEVIQNAYTDDRFEAYCQDFNRFKSDLLTNQANAVSLDVTLENALHLNGRAKLSLKVKSSTNRGILSAQLVEIGEKSYLQANPAIVNPRSVDNGRLFERENLVELPFVKGQERVLTKGHLNLQNRNGLLQIDSVVPDDWLTITLELQPTIYQLAKGAKLRLLLYTTDFEHTIRDNSDYTLTLKDVTLTLPVT